MHHLREILCVAAVATAAMLPGAAVAQESAERADRPPPECFRFTFGQWDPPLDWQGAGHPKVRGGEQGARGRGNAAHTERAGGPLLVFPAFWPAGVLIRFDPAARGDTLRGTATALVADAARTPSVAQITALRVSCDAPGAR